MGRMEDLLKSAQVQGQESAPTPQALRKAKVALNLSVEKATAEKLREAAGSRGISQLIESWVRKFLPVLVLGVALAGCAETPEGRAQRIERECREVVRAAYLALPEHPHAYGGIEKEYTQGRLPDCILKRGSER